jgi:quercetin dioxygenase-like cupin family protein
MDVVHLANLVQSERAHEFEGFAYDVPVAFFVIDAAPGARLALHRHPYPEVFVLQAGRACFIADEATIEAQAGQIVVVPMGAAHTYVNVGPDRLQMLGIHRNGRFVTEWLEG